MQMHLHTHNVASYIILCFNFASVAEPDDIVRWTTAASQYVLEVRTVIRCSLLLCLYYLLNTIAIVRIQVHIVSCRDDCSLERFPVIKIYNNITNLCYVRHVYTSWVPATWTGRYKIKKSS